jgi:hypothetical protein
MVPEISTGAIGPTHPATLKDLGSTSTVTSVTLALGASTTGMPATFPAVFVTLEATQHLLAELSGSMTCHQPPSPDFPVICELVPTLKPLSTIHPVPGPRRQLTATSLGEATGTLGVELAVGGGVLDGRGDCVGATVGEGSVTDGVITATVGVSVGRLEGRLQASIAMLRMSGNNKLRDFIASPFVGVHISTLRHQLKEFPKTGVRALKRRPHLCFRALQVSS